MIATDRSNQPIMKKQNTTGISKRVHQDEDYVMKQIESNGRKMPRKNGQGSFELLNSSISYVNVKETSQLLLFPNNLNQESDRTSFVTANQPNQQLIETEKQRNDHLVLKVLSDNENKQNKIVSWHNVEAVKAEAIQSLGKPHSKSNSSRSKRTASIFDSDFTNT